MPKIVDYAQRRSEIVDGFLTLIAKEGLANATSRSLADHLGVSNGALWRYFSDKNDLLTEANEKVIENTHKRALEALADVRGVEAVVTLVEALLPLTPISKDEARIVVGFWGLASSSLSVERVGRPELVEWGGMLRSLLDEAVSLGELSPDAPLDALAAMFMAQVVNAQIEFVFKGDLGTDDMAAPVRALLDAFRP
ncbi:TetR/AcrR family transcriptional regulator [Propionicicella superfundia]|uniref:TetR/AcrR family transcriptional regulator n=1 Tax=Propionicicella superfundia TaxID=348582 RepID=UPI00040917B5|nr:TetR/AcrR family transcriptional regulator [Propionicicella superfundia]